MRNVLLRHVGLSKCIYINSFDKKYEYANKLAKLVCHFLIWWPSLKLIAETVVTYTFVLINNASNHL